MNGVHVSEYAEVNFPMYIVSGFKEDSISSDKGHHRLVPRPMMDGVNIKVEGVHIADRAF